MRPVVVVEKSAATHERMRNWIAKAKEVTEIRVEVGPSERNVPLAITGCGV